MEKRKRGKGEKGKGKKEKEKRQGKRKKKEKDCFWLTQENMQNLFGKKAYFFPRGKEYHIFSPNSIYQKNMHNLFGERISHFFP